MEVNKRQMKFNEYLATILSPEQIKNLKVAISTGKTIVIDGRPGRTGKTTLKNILNKRGCKAIEEYDIFRITLSKPLNSAIAELSTKVLP